VLLFGIDVDQIPFGFPLKIQIGYVKKLSELIELNIINISSLKKNPRF